MRITATFEFTDEIAPLHTADRRGAADFAALAEMLRRHAVQFLACDIAASEFDEDLAEPDMLADVAAVLGAAPRMPVREVMQHLAGHDDRYREWTNRRFKAAMDTAGAPTFKSNGLMHVHGLRVRAALDARSGNGS